MDVIFEILHYENAEIGWWSIFTIFLSWVQSNVRNEDSTCSPSALERWNSMWNGEKIIFKYLRLLPRFQVKFEIWVIISWIPIFLIGHCVEKASEKERIFPVFRTHLPFRWLLLCLQLYIHTPVPGNEIRCVPNETNKDFGSSVAFSIFLFFFTRQLTWSEQKKTVKNERFKYNWYSFPDFMGGTNPYDKIVMSLFRCSGSSSSQARSHIRCN